MQENGKAAAQESRIGRDFSFWQLVGFALPAILTSLCGQLFRSLDDGLFISRYVGEQALASINLLTPVNCVIMGFANLFSIGACTLSAQKMGEGDPAEAKRIFTRVTVSAAVTGFAIALIMNLFCAPICRFLGADDALLANTMTYVRIVISNTAVSLVGTTFTSYFSTAGRPDMGLICSVLSGVVNIALDILFVAVLGLGVVGSSLSTVIGELAVTLVGLVFYLNKKHEISFVKPGGRYLETTLAASRSGFSQFINSISLSVTSYVTNILLLQLLGSNGVAANSIVSDLRRVLTSSFIGYAGCVGPVIAYNFGSRNAPRLRRILGYNLKFLLCGSALITAAGLLLREPLIGIFIHADRSPELFAMTYEGLTIEYCSCLFTAGCIFTMRMFVALGAPRTAAVLTTLRNFVIRLSMLLLLPRLFGELGIWLAFPVSEAISFLVALALVVANADNYGYGHSGVAWRMQRAGEPAVPAAAEGAESAESI